MKAYHIKDLLKKEVLIVELPQNGYYSLSENGLNIRDCNSCLLANIKGHYTLLGKPYEIKEEDAKGLVNLHENGYYKDYINGNNFFTLPSKSLLSALESEIYWENPYGKEPIENLQSSTFSGEKTIIHRNPMNILWNEAESRTFDKKRVKILVKI